MIDNKLTNSELTTKICQDREVLLFHTIKNRFV